MRRRHCTPIRGTERFGQRCPVPASSPRGAFGEEPVYHPRGLMCHAFVRDPSSVARPAPCLPGHRSKPFTAGIAEV